MNKNKQETAKPDNQLDLMAWGHININDDDDMESISLENRWR